MNPMYIIKTLYNHYRMLKYSLLLRRNFWSNRVLFANKPRISRKNSVVFIGADIYIGHDCHIGADLLVGNKVLIASNVAFVGGDHNYKVVGSPIKDSNRDDFKTIIIEDDVWIGHGATILHGITIHEGAIVAAGSIVTKDVEPHTIVAGNPAKKIKDRFSVGELKEHKKLIRLSVGH